MKLPVYQVHEEQCSVDGEIRSGVHRPIGLQRVHSMGRLVKLHSFIRPGAGNGGVGGKQGGEGSTLGGVEGGQQGGGGSTLGGVEGGQRGVG